MLDSKSTRLPSLKKKKKKNYLFLVVLGLHSCMGFSLVVEIGDHSLFIVVQGLLTAVASPVAEHRL